MMRNQVYKNSCQTTNKHKQPVMIAVFLCLVATVTSSAINNDIQEILNSVNQLNDAKQTVVLQNGLRDAKTVVGKLFKYTIPEDTFEGDVQRITVNEDTADELPSWLVYDKASRTLSGVPSHEDLGQHYVQVTAYSNDAKAQDVFAIGVVEKSPNSPVKSTESETNNKIQPIACQDSEPVTVVTIVVDADLSKLLAAEKVDVLGKLTDHLGLGEDFLTMLPVGNKPLFDSSAVVAGPGDAKKPEHPGAFISWNIGCGAVHKNHMPILEHLESSSQDGTMSQKIGLPVVGWHVTSNKQVKPSRRLKRQIRAGSTPLVKPIEPTKVVGDTMFVEGTDVIAPTRTIDVVTPTMREETTKEPLIVPTAEPTPMMTSEVVMPSRPFSTSEPTATPEIPTPEIPMGETVPKLRNPIDRIEVNVGDILHYKIPKDTFYDYEDGNTRKLRLTLTTPEGTTIHVSSWINLDEQKQVLLGLPMLKDVGVHEFVLTAIDSTFSMARDAFEVVVKPPADRKINHEIAMTLDLDYEKFIVDTKEQIEVASAIGKSFGDRNSKSITVLSISKGSVVYAWTNNSVSSDTCPVRQVVGLLEKLVYENGTLKKEMLDKMHPYRVTKVAIKPVGACTNTTDFPAVTSATSVETTTEFKTGERKPNEDDKWVVTVVPAVVIGAMLLLAGIIACILYRKKRKGKMSDEDQHTFINKGIPIIFADELDDKPDPPTKPLIMDEEKAPIPPPEYHRSATNSPPSTPPSDHKEPIEDSPEEIEDDTAPYQAPQPPTANHDDKNKSRPRTEPSYQPSPPPYVPP